MKKILAAILSVMMLMSLAACAATEPTPEAPQLEGVSAPVDILNTVWESYEEENKFFAMGGDVSDTATPVDNAPGAVDITNTDFLTYNMVCSADAAAMIDDAASLIHAMNANTFTGACYHLTDAADKDAFVTATKDAIQNNQWMCGFPEKLYIATVTDEYVVVAFGAADLIDTFSAKLTAAYDVTTEVVNEALA